MGLGSAYTGWPRPRMWLILLLLWSVMPVWGGTREVLILDQHGKAIVEYDASQPLVIAVSPQADGKSHPPYLDPKSADARITITVSGPPGSKMELTRQTAAEADALLEEKVAQMLEQRKTSSADPETEMWHLVRESLQPADVATFLRAYPHGKYAPAARLKLQQLQRLQGTSWPSVATLSVPESPMPKPLSLLRNSIGMDMLLIPAGEFFMGSDNGDADERPVHKVILSQPFYLGKYEVTQAQWVEVMGTNPSHFKGNLNRPVERVSWHMVQEFIRRLNAREGHNKYRLPTEAEWEYAARAGAATRYSFGDDESLLPQYAWYNRNDGGTTHPVGRLKPNAWGLYDMHGNVWEWVQDWRGPYVLGVIINPQGPATGQVKGYRGGGWGYGAARCRVAKRSYDPPDYVYGTHGFRLARTAP